MQESFVNNPNSIVLIPYSVYCFAASAERGQIKLATTRTKSHDFSTQLKQQLRRKRFNNVFLPFT
jgi:hypothetical protein